MLGSRDLATVREAVLFASLPDELAELILQRAATRAFRRGETIFLQGETAQHLYVVLDGWVKLFRITSSGAEAVVGVFTKGRSFGEAVAINGDPYPVSAEAVTDARVVSVRANVLTSLMQERPEIARAVLSSTFIHLHGLISQIEQLKSHTGAQRVAEFLLDLCPAAEGPCRITLPYDKSLIAGRLGMQPPSLSRAFNRLEALGVTIDHNHAIIDDVAALRDYMLEDRSAPWRKAE
ncbi:MAG: Crp/Fnr family transcriptional regulator [Hyphomicrobiaceae bacterium]